MRPESTLVQNSTDGTTQYRTNRGVKQGAPLSSIAFAAAIHPILLEIQERIAPMGGQVVAIADDIHILCSAEHMLATITNIEQELHDKARVRVQPTKCWTYSPTPDTAFTDERWQQLWAEHKFKQYQHKELSEDLRGKGCIIDGVPFSLNSQFVKAAAACIQERAISRIHNVQQTERNIQRGGETGSPGILYSLTILHPTHG